MRLVIAGVAAGALGLVGCSNGGGYGGPEPGADDEVELPPNSDEIGPEEDEEDDVPFGADEVDPGADDEVELPPE